MIMQKVRVDHHKISWELWHRAGELGNALANHNIGTAYLIGRGVVRSPWASNNRGGCKENLMQAIWIKHWSTIWLRWGVDTMNLWGWFNKCTRMEWDDYAKAYQTYLCEIKSDDRDKAAAYSDEFVFVYYEWFEAIRVSSFWIFTK